MFKDERNGKTIKGSVRKNESRIKFGFDRYWSYFFKEKMVKHD